MDDGNESGTQHAASSDKAPHKLAHFQPLQSRTLCIVPASKEVVMLPPLLLLTHSPVVARQPPDISRLRPECRIQCCQLRVHHRQCSTNALLVLPLPWRLLVGLLAAPCCCI